MKLIEKNQLVGKYGGYAVFRDLFETEDGKRISVPTSREFLMQMERTLSDGSLTQYPSLDIIFSRHCLKGNNL